MTNLPSAVIYVATMADVHPCTIIAHPTDKFAIAFLLHNMVLYFSIIKTNSLIKKSTLQGFEKESVPYAERDAECCMGSSLDRSFAEQ